MNDTSATKSTCIVIIITAVCAILFLVIILSPLGAIGLEGLSVKIQINNPYVDNNFRDWHSVFITETKNVYIPNGWVLKEDNKLYTILDENGEIWGYGALFGSKDERFENYTTLIKEVSLANPEKLSIDPFVQFKMMDGSDIDEIIIQEESGTKNIYCIQLLIDAEVTFTWFLTEDISASETQYDIAEAFVYSFAFEKDRERQGTVPRPDS